MNTSLFDSSFFSTNRRRLRERLQTDAPIVLTANGLLQRSADTAFSFQQDANFWYLTGITEPDVVLVMDEGQEYLIIPRREAIREAFDGSIDQSLLRKHSGITQMVYDQEGWERLSERLVKISDVATVAAPPAYISQYGMFTNPARERLIGRMRESNPELAIIDAGQEIVRMRMVKQTPELATIQAAIDVTIDSMQTLLEPAQLKQYSHEYEIEADLTREFRHRGAASHAFDPIIASGKRACVLHNVANTGKLSRKDLLVMDVGAEVGQYAADITRTVALGKPTARQQAVFNAVLDVQQYAKSLLKPGVLIKEYEQEVEKYMGKTLQTLGVLNDPDHETIRRYYPHATSHHLGLNVHDPADYTQPLEPGMVITVEPGIYLLEEAIGVRIEDDILITKNGIQVLSARLPAQLA